MKRKRRILSVLLATICLITSLLSVDAFAATKDVTSSMSSNKQLKKIIKYISEYTTLQIMELKSGATVTEDMSGENLLSIAAYVGSAHLNKIEFTKKEIQTITYNLFGKKPSVSLIPSISSQNRKHIVKKYDSSQTKPYVYIGGNWGEDEPKYSIVKIEKVKSGVYNVTIKNKTKYGSSTTTYGKTVIKLKKSSKSAYGYIIKSITYKRK